MSTKLKLLPAFVMLLAGAFTSIITFVIGYTLKSALIILLFVLVIFYILGLVLQKLIVGEAAFEHLSQGRFTRRVLPFLPYCRIIRGERTYITLLLRKVFVEESLQMDCKSITSLYRDEEARYEYQLGMTLDEGYIGNAFDENVITYIIHYWSVEDCNKDFKEVFLRDIEQLRNLIEKFFISIEETFRFDISHDESPLTLSDDENFYYLDYNTNI